MRYLIIILISLFTTLALANDADKVSMVKDKSIIYTNTTATRNGIVYILKKKSKAYDLVKKAKAPTTKRGKYDRANRKASGHRTQIRVYCFDRYYNFIDDCIL